MKKLIIIIMLSSSVAFAGNAIVVPRSGGFNMPMMQRQVVQPRVINKPPPQPVQKYNPMGNRWETTYPDSQLTHNPMENNWEYTKPGTRPVFNPMENKWEFPK